MRDVEKPAECLIDQTATETADETTETATDAQRPSLRPLQGRDLFRFAAILSKMGIRQLEGIFDADAVKAAAKDAAKGGSSVEAVGLQVVMDAASVVLANLGRVEADVYALLADLSGLTAENVASLPMGDFTGMVVDVVTADGFRDFFTQVKRLLR